MTLALASAEAAALPNLLEKELKGTENRSVWELGATAALQKAHWLLVPS